MSVRVTLALLWFACAIEFSGRLGAQGKPTGSDATANQSYPLGPGDQLLVRCFQAPEFGEQSYRIDDDGELTLPLLGRIKAAGFSIREFELELTRRLGESIRAPQVAVVMVNYRSQPMSVIGEVTTPGLHQLEGRKTLIEVLSLGGGLRTTAGPTVQITRRVEYGPIPLPGAAPDRTGTFYVANVELKKVLGGDPISNIEIKPFDVVAVAKAAVVYVLGEVHKPGGFALSDKATLSALEAVSMAEGLLSTAAPKKARIVREVGDGLPPQEIELDLSKVIEGRAGSVILRPNDILFVPTHAAKNAAIRALQIAVQTGSGIAIYRR